MNGSDSKKLVNRHYAVSIGVLITIVGGVWFMATSNATIQAKVENIEDDYIPRGELNQRLINIEGSVERIESYLIK